MSLMSPSRTLTLPDPGTKLRPTAVERSAAEQAAYEACMDTIRALQEENAVLRQSADQFAALAERLQKALTRERTRTSREAPIARRAGDEPESVARQIEQEYRAIPNLRLTRWQAARLWNLDQVTCDAAIATLVDKRVLRETPGGFVRRDEPQGRARHAV